MLYREAQPSRLLGTYIKRFWSLEYDPSGAAAEAETVLPDGCPEIVFNLSDRFHRLGSGVDELQPAALFAGQMVSSIAIRPTGSVRLFGVRFQPAGAAPICGIPMSELTGRIVGIECILGKEAFELEARIREVFSFEARIAEFERFLIEKLAGLQREDRLAAYASRMIAAQPGALLISRLCEHLGVSDRQLERRFKSLIGLSPKKLARILRFQSFVTLLQNAKTPDILDRSLETGYYDQSHAIRDFREFSGMTPLGYFQATHRMSDAFTGASNGHEAAP